jgi:transposase
MNPLVEPADHALGRSRGGLSTKVHHACDGGGRPLAVLVGPGQGGDAPMLPFILGAIRVPRHGVGRARTRPDRVLTDKAYSSPRDPPPAAFPRHRRRHSSATRSAVARKRRGRSGGRPVSYDTEAYKHRNVVERSFNALKHWRGLATRYDKLAVIYRGGAVLAAILAWLRG